MQFETVGSLLRPLVLTKARDNKSPKQWEIESEEITKIVEKQIKLGFKIVTDGEFRREWWHLDFAWGLQGIQKSDKEHGYSFVGLETRKDVGIDVVAPLSGLNHPFLSHFKFLKELVNNRCEVKLTIPSPAQIYSELAQPYFLKTEASVKSVYKNYKELKKGLTNAYKQFISDYQKIGGTIIQFDDCLWEMFSKDNHESPLPKGIPHFVFKIMAKAFINLNNDLADYAHSLGLRVFGHNCRGNYESHHMCSGSYSSIANTFLKKLRYDKFFLEWDDDRSGDILALKVFQKKTNEIVLGLLSSKTSTLDDEKRVIELLDKASTIIDKRRLYLSHQCGFASTKEGNHLTIEDQWKKIQQGIDISKRYWVEHND
jgi:methionine synthase II (cobalamin-independent)